MLETQVPSPTPALRTLAPAWPAAKASTLHGDQYSMASTGPADQVARMVRLYHCRHRGSPLVTFDNKGDIGWATLFSVHLGGFQVFSHRLLLTSKYFCFLALTCRMNLTAALPRSRVSFCNLLYMSEPHQKVPCIPLALCIKIKSLRARVGGGGPQGVHVCGVQPGRLSGLLLGLPSGNILPGDVSDHLFAESFFWVVAQ